MPNIHKVIKSLTDFHFCLFLNAMKNSGFTIWMSGLSGAGKTTLATQLSTEMNALGLPTIVLDGDQLRNTLSKDLGYSMGDRMAQNTRVAYIAKLLNDQNVNVITTLISPTEEIRSMAKEIIGAENFKMLFIDCPYEVCEARDVKGLYRQAKDNMLNEFTGNDQAFERPENPWMKIETDNLTIAYCINKIIEGIKGVKTNQLK